MAAESNGYRAGLVRRQLTPGLISSLLGPAGLRPFISFSTSYPERWNFWDATITPGFVRQRRQISFVSCFVKLRTGNASFQLWEVFFVEDLVVAQVTRNILSFVTSRASVYNALEK
jgi:hypothetical protein